MKILGKCFEGIGSTCVQCDRLFGEKLNDTNDSNPDSRRVSPTSGNSTSIGIHP
ncbi:MAG: hypothetical protein AAFO04_18680 [Cyanobacteria bacterium J06592_8]